MRILDLNWLSVKRTVPKLTINDNVTAMLLAALYKKSKKFGCLIDVAEHIEPNVFKFIYLMRTKWAVEFNEYLEEMKAVSTDTAFIQSIHKPWEYLKYAGAKKRISILHTLNEFVDFTRKPDQEGWTDLRNFVLGTLRTPYQVATGTDLMFRI